MSGLADFAQNKITDAVWRQQALAAPATLYFALFTCTKGIRLNSTAYALNDTIVVLIGGKYYFYKCTTGGTSAAAQPGTYLAAQNEVITDGTAVFTEQTLALGTGTAIVEVSGGSYARVAITASLANFAGTQGAGTTAASNGVGGTTSNNVPITFPAPTAQWHPTGGQIVGIAVYDASSAGNLWHWAMLNAPKSVNNGDPAPSVANAAWTDKIGD